MYCSKCGSQIADGANYCSECGAKVNNGDSLSQNEDRPWVVFARIGNVFGTVGLFTIIIYGIILCIPGLVFSIIGYKSKKAENKYIAKCGIIKNIIGIAVSIGIVLAFFIIMIINPNFVFPYGL